MDYRLRLLTTTMLFLSGVAALIYQTLWIKQLGLVTGVDVYAITTGISAFFAGVVGSFYAHYILILTPSSVFPVGIMIELLAMVFIGGFGTFMGPVLGAFILTVGLEYLRFLGEYRFITYGILIVLVVLFMPQGLAKSVFPDKRILE